METGNVDLQMEFAPDRRVPPRASDGMKRLEAWLSLPDDDRAELLDGRIVYKVMAGPEHGAASGGIYAQLDRMQGPPGAGGGWWLSMDVDMYLAGQGVRPDLAGWRADRHPRMPQKVNVGTNHLGVIVAPPDWVCEVLSVSTQARDLQEGVKWQAYHEAGVGHYWIVDLDLGRITVYQNTPRGFEPIDMADYTSVKVLPPFTGVEFSARRVFEVVAWFKVGQPPAP